MKLEVHNIDLVRKKIDVVLPKERVSAIEESIYDELRKTANLKGFRKGKVPKSIIALYFKDYIKSELKRRIVEDSIEEVLREANVKPLLEPEIEFVDSDGTWGYTIYLEVAPEIEISGYKGVEVEVKPIEVREDEIEERIEKLRSLHAELLPKEKEVPAKEGDLVIVKYDGYLDGVPLEEVKSESYPVELGTGILLPEFENAILGMKTGEEKEIEIDFPPDYPDRNYASKRIKFHIYVKEIKEKKLPEINDEFAKDLGLENMEALRKKLADDMRKEKEGIRREFIQQKIMDRILENNEIPVPPLYMQRRAEEILANMKKGLNGKAYTKEEMEKLEKEMKERIERDLKERIKQEIVVANIARKENLDVEEAEIENRLKKLAEDMKKPFEEVKAYYSKSGLITSIKSTILEEKTINFLIENAVIKEINP